MPLISNVRHHATPMERFTSAAGIALFLTAIAAHLMFGINAFVRVVGVSCVLCGINWCITKKIPVGWEDQPPNSHIQSWVAFVVGLLMLVLGICLVFFASLSACLLGWSNTAC